MREAEVDGNAAALLFGEAIGIGSSERLRERGFAVIYMTGGADDDVAHSFIVAFPTAHISAASDAANPTDNPKTAKLFQIIECFDAMAIQICTPHNAPIRDPKSMRTIAPITPTNAP